MKPATRDLILILLWPIAATIISFAVNANFIESQLLFFGIPLLYLAMRDMARVPKAALFAAAFSVPLVAVFGYLFEYTRTYVIATNVPARLFGVLSIDVFLWGFLYFFLVVLYYEHFLARHARKEPLWPKKFSLGLFLLGSILALFFAILGFAPNLLEIRYYYLKFGLVLVLPPIVLMLAKFPALWAKFAKAGAYFFYLSFLYEITALKLGQWWFPSPDFIGFITLFGVTFPFEELLFWIILGSLGVLVYYEFFDDEEK
jgi:hypothetical protein